MIKSLEEVAIMKQAGKVAAAVLQKLKDEVRPGIRTKRLDALAASEFQRHGAKASFKGYRGFPGHICISVNDEIVHGIPDERMLKEGDIVSIDCGAFVKGFHGDVAATVGVGKISSKAQTLLNTAEVALMEGIKVAHSGAHLGDISAAIQKYVETRGFSVVREYSGHGVGRNLHEDPLVPNFGVVGEGPVLRKGMTLALEPMVNEGGFPTRLSDNHWTVLTADGSLSAHFEHTIAVNDGEAEILTIL